MSNYTFELAAPGVKTRHNAGNYDPNLSKYEIEVMAPDEIMGGRQII